MQRQTIMKNKSGKLRGEEKKNQTTTKRVKIAGVIYGDRALADCMKAVIKLRMGK